MKLDNDENLEILPLVSDPLVLYVNDQHPFAQKNQLKYLSLEMKNNFT